MAIARLAAIPPKPLGLLNIPALKHLFTFQNINNLASKTYFAEAL